MFDVIIANIDTLSYCCMSPENELSKADKEKREKYLQPYLNHRHHFTPLILSSGGIPVSEVQATALLIASHLRSNLKQYYSYMCGFDWERMSLAIVISYTILI